MYRHIMKIAINCERKKEREQGKLKGRVAWKNIKEESCKCCLFAPGHVGRKEHYNDN